MFVPTKTRLLLAARGDRARDPSTEAGLTIIEALVAIIIIAIIGVMITPPLILAVATRLQNQRAQQAYQIAQGEMDRVRGLVENGRHEPAVLPDVVAGDLAAVDPPSGAIDDMRSVNATCDSYDGTPLASQDALPIDLTGDCEADFIMQVFRTNGVTSDREAASLNRPINFSMIVRVYAVLDDINDVPWGDLGTEEASIRMRSGDGPQSTQPLAILTSQLNWSDTRDSLCEFQRPNGGCE